MGNKLDSSDATKHPEFPKNQKKTNRNRKIAGFALRKPNKKNIKNNMGCTVWKTIYINMK